LDAVTLEPNDTELDGVTLLELLRDTEFVGVTVDEHDINNGLHDRVADDDGTLLCDILVVADNDIRLNDKLGDMLFEGGLDNVGVILNPRVSVLDVDNECEILGEIEAVCDPLKEPDTD